VHARHILVANTTSANEPANEPKSPREQVRDAVEKDKQQKLLDEIVARSHVTVAENVTLNPNNRWFAVVAN
jgi:hypothetical protein